MSNSMALTIFFGSMGYTMLLGLVVIFSGRRR